MMYRPFTELDYESLHALDLEHLRLEYPAFDALPEQERQGRIRTSLPSLRFFERSEHSFVAAEPEGPLHGAIFAQPVWQGDRPTVLISRLWAGHEEVLRGLLRACTKSAFDTGVYELHGMFPARWLEAGALEEFRSEGLYAVRYLGGRSSTAPGRGLLEGTGPA